MRMKTSCVRKAEREATNCTQANMVPYFSLENHSLPVKPAPMKPKEAPSATRICAATKPPTVVENAKLKMPRVSRAQATGRTVRMPSRSSTEPEKIWNRAKKNV